MSVFQRHPLLVLAVIALIGLAGAARAGFVRVPQEYPTITEAVESVIADQIPDATVLVAGGPYSESVTVSSGPPFSIVGGGLSEVHWRGDEGPCLSSLGSAEISVFGFLLEDSSNSGMLANGGDLSIESCVIRGNSLHGVEVSGESHVELFRCTIEDNPPWGTSTPHGAVWARGEGASVMMEEVEIQTDRYANASTGVRVDAGAAARLFNSRVITAGVGVQVSGANSSVEVVESTFADCETAITIDGGRLNAGNLENADHTDDGRNIFHLSNERYLIATGGGRASAEGNIFGRIDAAHFADRVSGEVDVDPACQVVIDRVYVFPEFWRYPRFSDGQWLEVRLRATEPSEHTISLTGWQISDDPRFDDGNEGYAVIQEEVSLEVNESCLLAINLEEASEEFTLIPDAKAVDINSSPRIILAFLSGDELLIRPDDYGIMDAVFFGDAGDDPEPPHWFGEHVRLPREDEILMRSASSEDTNTPGDWSFSYLEGRVIYAPREGIVAH